MPFINFAKTTTPLSIAPNDIIQEKTKAIVSFFDVLHADDFQEEAAFDILLEYIRLHDRILYAPISNEIYSCYSENKADLIMGTVTSNIDKLLIYAISKECNNRMPTSPIEKKQWIDTQKAVLKIWDHINLAQQQYSVLKQSDEEYQQKFENSINPYKEEIAKDMNSQLLTMVSIFTALAFLVFGGISSLDNIFSTQGIPLLKLMCVGTIWGLCILNLIFVFLFCISKMTSLNFGSTDEPTASIFKKYPIVWWTDLILISILVLCSWTYYVRKNNFDSWIFSIFQGHPRLVVLAISFFIFAVIVAGVILLAKATVHPKQDNQITNKGKTRERPRNRQ